MIFVCLDHSRNHLEAWRHCHCPSLSLAPVNLNWFHLLGFTFLVTAYPGSPKQHPRGPLNGCVGVGVMKKMFNMPSSFYKRPTETSVLQVSAD